MASYSLLNTCFLRKASTATLSISDAFNSLLDELQESRHPVLPSRVVFAILYFYYFVKMFTFIGMKLFMVFLLSVWSSPYLTFAKPPFSSLIGFTAALSLVVLGQPLSDIVYVIAFYQKKKLTESSFCFTVS